MMTKIINLGFAFAIVSLVGFGIINYVNSTLREKSIDANGNSINEKENAPEKVISEYCQLAKEENFADLENIVIRTPPSYWQYVFNEDKLGQGDANTLGTTQKSSLEPKAKDQNTKPLDEFSYTDASKIFPTIIFKKKLIMKEILEIIIKNNESRVRVKLISENDNKFFIIEDFFLYKDRSESWKIFRIAYPITRENYPN